MRISDWSSDVCSSDLMQQFAARVYGPVIAYGVAWWHGAESNYWGHNAMIRTRAFAQCAGLPELRGVKPFAGTVLSHDFVEAALMRRGGRALHMVPSLGGSYEEGRSEEHTSELQSLMRNSYAVFCLKKNKTHNTRP